MYLLLCQIRDIIGMSSGMPRPKTGTTHYHTQLGHPDKGRTIKKVGCLQYLGARAFGPTKLLMPRFLPIVPCGVNRIK